MEEEDKKGVKEKEKKSSASHLFIYRSLHCTKFQNMWEDKERYFLDFIEKKMEEPRN